MQAFYNVSGNGHGATLVYFGAQYLDLKKEKLRACAARLVESQLKLEERLHRSFIFGSTH